MKRLLFVMVVVGVTTLNAHALLTLTLQDSGGSTVTVQDLDGDGLVSYNGPVGASVWKTNVTTGVSKPILGGPYLAEIDLNTVNVTSEDPGTLKIMLTDDNFVLADAVKGNALLSSWIGGTSTGSEVKLIQTASWEDATGKLVSFSVTNGPFNALTDPAVPGAFSEEKTMALPFIDNPFSLTEELWITHSDGGQITSLDAYSKVVPIPGSVVLGLLGLGAVCVKLRRV